MCVCVCVCVLMESVLSEGLEDDTDDAGIHYSVVAV